MDNSFIAQGLMSGTSLDGIDASIIKSDGENNLDKPISFSGVFDISRNIEICSKGGVIYLLNC